MDVRVQLLTGIIFRRDEGKVRIFGKELSTDSHHVCLQRATVEKLNYFFVLPNAYIKLFTF